MKRTEIEVTELTADWIGKPASVVADRDSRVTGILLGFSIVCRSSLSDAAGNSIRTKCYADLEFRAIGTVRVPMDARVEPL